MRLRAAALGCAALLGACATAPVVTREQAEAAWAVHRHNVSAIRSFDLQGRVAGSALGVKADVLWHQAADGSYEINLSGPFGAGAARLRGNAQRVEITTEDGVYVTDRPEDWLQEKMGWTLPVAHLRWWALGLPAPDSPAQMELDDSGHVAELRQDGWHLSYDSYMAVDRWSLPHRFDVTGSSATLRVLADQWTPVVANP